MVTPPSTTQAEPLCSITALARLELSVRKRASVVAYRAPYALRTLETTHSVTRDRERSIFPGRATGDLSRGPPSRRHTLLSIPPQR